MTLDISGIRKRIEPDRPVPLPSEKKAVHVFRKAVIGRDQRTSTENVSVNRVLGEEKLGRSLKGIPARGEKSAVTHWLAWPVSLMGPAPPREDRMIGAQERKKSLSFCFLK
jgi:hypothetical protein